MKTAPPPTDGSPMRSASHASQPALEAMTMMESAPSGNLVAGPLGSSSGRWCRLVIGSTVALGRFPEGARRTRFPGIPADAVRALGRRTGWGRRRRCNVLELHRGGRDQYFLQRFHDRAGGRGRHGRNGLIRRVRRDLGIGWYRSRVPDRSSWNRWIGRVIGSVAVGASFAYAIGKNEGLRRWKLWPGGE